MEDLKKLYQTAIDMYDGSDIITSGEYTFEYIPASPIMVIIKKHFDTEVIRYDFSKPDENGKIEVTSCHKCIDESCIYSEDEYVGFFYM